MFNNPLSSFTTKVILILGLVLAIGILGVVKKCDNLKSAKKEKEKQVKIYEKEKVQNKKSIEVYNEGRKDEIKNVEDAIDHYPAIEKDQPIPTDEELKDIRKKIGDKFKEGLPK